MSSFDRNKATEKTFWLFSWKNLLFVWSCFISCFQHLLSCLLSWTSGDNIGIYEAGLLVRKINANGIQNCSYLQSSTKSNPRVCEFFWKLQKKKCLTQKKDNFGELNELYLNSFWLIYLEKPKLSFFSPKPFFFLKNP